MPLVDRDVVIVGGGIVGMASALYLARAGRRTLVVEKGVVGGEASGRNGGHISPTVDPAWGPLGKLAYELWPNLAEELGSAVEYRRAGGLYVVMADEPIEPEQLVRFRHAHGFAAEVLSAEDCARVIPGLRHDVKGGVFAPKTGHINPIMTMKLLLKAARAAGAEVWERCSVTGLRSRDGHTEGVETDRGVVSAPFVVNAAGPWAWRIGRMADLDIPVMPRRIQILLSEAMPPRYQSTFTGNTLYARQAFSGQLHFGAMGPAWEGSAWYIDRSVTLPTMQRIARRMVELVPELADVRILRSWSGVIGVSADGAPILELCSEPKGLVLATGFGGNGFVTGPAVGRIVTELICHGRTEVDIRHLTLSRFRDSPRARESFEEWQRMPLHDRETAAWSVGVSA
jgi:sarcosine oxidase, subunit beta